VGTPEFASITSHLGLSQSRKDDLMSIFYVLLFLHKGHLPWTLSDGITDIHETLAEILELKL